MELLSDEMVASAAGDRQRSGGDERIEGVGRLLEARPSAIVVVGYGAAFYLLALTLDQIPVGIAYAIWSGVGIVLVSVAGLLLFGQRLDLAGVVGIGLIVAGVGVISLFSETSAH